MSRASQILENFDELNDQVNEAEIVKYGIMGSDLHKGETDFEELEAAQVEAAKMADKEGSEYYVYAYDGEDEVIQKWRQNGDRNSWEIDRT